MMQKYTDGTEIRYFEAGVDVSDWIDLTQYRLMTEEEVLKHETPKPTRWHTLWVWDKETETGHWEDSRTAEEISEYNRSQMQKLTKRQFVLQLDSIRINEKETMYDQVLLLLSNNRTAKIEYDTVADIERLSPTVLTMSQALNLTNEQVDDMWIEALQR